MGDAAAMHSIEELREALLAAGRERDALMLAHAHAQHLLTALESLLRVNSQEDLFESVFAALHQVFTFSQSMMLADSGESHLECIVGHPPSLVGSRWTIGPLFQKVLGGRVASTFSSLDIAEWRDAAALDLSAEQSALYLPVAGASAAEYSCCCVRPAKKASTATTWSSRASSRSLHLTRSPRATRVRVKSRKRSCAT